MSARLIAEMRQRAVGLAERASLYASTGERELASLARAAANRIADACEAAEEFDRAEGEAANRELEA